MSAEVAHQAATAQILSHVGTVGKSVALGSAALLAIGVITWKAWPASWPAKDADLSQPTLKFDPSFETKRIYLDAGHGAEDNTGNRGALDQLEQDFTLSVAEDIAPLLTATGKFEVRICRKQGEKVAYADRVAAANAWKADVFISLHSDVRRPEAVGFSILWSDEGSDDEDEARVGLARSTARQLSAIGLPAYNGDEYATDYDGDSTAGVFVDRHAMHQRIFVLRKPSMPSIIVETHNAKSGVEAERWDEPAVREAFAMALAAAIAER